MGRTTRPILLAIVGVTLTTTVLVATPAPTAVADESLGRVTGPWSLAMYRQDPFGDAAPNAAWEETSANLSVDRGFTDELVLTVSDGEQWGTLDLAAPLGEELEVGTYRGVTRAAFRRAHEPGFDLSRNGTGCSPGGGEFTVHQIADDLSVLHVSWATSCGYGEVRIGEPTLPDTVPGGASRVVASPYAVDWPAIHQGRTTDPVPLHVANPSELPLTVGPVRVEGPLAEEVDARSDCSPVLAPGARCTVTLTVSPDADGARRAELVVPTGRGDVRLPVRGSGIPGTSRLRLDDEESSSTWDTDRFVTSGGGTAHWAWFQFGRDAATSATLRLSAPPGGALVPGTYDDAGIAFAGPPSSANSGRLTILEATYDDRSGRLESMVATMAARRNRNEPIGNQQATLLWRSHRAMPDPQPVVRWRTGPVTGLSLHPTVGEARIGFDYPEGRDGPTSDVRDLAIRSTTGTRAPRDAEDGEAVPVERNGQNLEQSAVLRDLEPGRDYTVAFFVTPGRAPRPPPTVVGLRGTRVAMSARRQARGRQQVYGRLVTSGNRGLGGRRVLLDVRLSDGTRRTTHRVTGPRGGFRLVTARRAVVEATFPGAGTLLGGVGSIRGVR